MDVDTDIIDRAAADVEAAEQSLAEARQVYFQAVQDAVDNAGATAVSKAMGVSRVRIYQIIGQLRDD